MWQNASKEFRCDTWQFYRLTLSDFYNFNINKIITLYFIWKLCFILKILFILKITDRERKCLRFLKPKLRWKTYFFSARFIAFVLEGQQNPCDLTKDKATSVVHSLLLSTFFHIILFGRKSTCDGIFAPRQKYVKTKLFIFT